MNFEPIRRDIPKDIGKIEAFMRTTAPEGYLICDGSSYNTADYPLLVDMFTQEFGSAYYFGGSGSTFKVPDLRGEFLRGTGTGGTSGISGAAVGIHQQGTYHTHIFGCKGKSASTGNRIVFGFNSNQTTGGDTLFDYQSYWRADKDLGRTNNFEVVVDTTGTNTGSTWGSYMARPTNTSVLYCIKAY